MDCSISDIGARIAAMRKQRGISQDDLAKKLSVSREVVAKWENGTRDLKTQYTVGIANYFKVSCDEILRGIKASNISINERTGLSDKAIEALIFGHQHNRSYDVDIANHIIESGGFGVLVSDVYKLIVGAMDDKRALEKIAQFRKIEDGHVEKLSKDEIITLQRIQREMQEAWEEKAEFREYQIVSSFRGIAQIAFKELLPIVERKKEVLEEEASNDENQ
jgi:transcriptional regulator with XRE-family HTH domain